MDTEITPAVRSAVTELIAWYDRGLDEDDDMDGDLTQFLESIVRLKAAAPYPHGQLGADIAHVIKPGPTTTRRDHIDALERLRILTRPDITIRSHVDQLALEDGV